MWKFIKENPWLFAGLAFFILLGIGLGVGLTVTGIFAPFGLSLLGLLGAGSLLFGAVATPPTIILSVLARRLYVASRYYEVETENPNFDLKKNKKEVSSVTSDTETVSSESQVQKTPVVEAVPYGQPSSVPYVPPVLVTSANGPQVNPNTQPQIATTTPLVAPVFVAPVASTPPEPVATKEEAGRVKQRILEIVQPKDGKVPSGAYFINDSEFGSLDVIVDDATKNATVRFVRKAFYPANSFYDPLAKENQNHHDPEFGQECPHFDKIKPLTELISFIEDSFGVGSSIEKISTLVQLSGSQSCHQYQFSFEISPENVKRIVEQLDKKDPVNVTHSGPQAHPTVSSTQTPTTAVNNNSSVQIPASLPLARESSVSTSASSQPEQRHVFTSGAGTGATSPRGNGGSSTGAASPVFSASSAFFPAPASPPSSPQVSTKADAAQVVMQDILDTFKDRVLIKESRLQTEVVDMGGAGAKIVYTMSAEFNTLSPKKTKKASSNPPETLAKLVKQMNVRFKKLDSKCTDIIIEKKEVGAAADNRKNQFYFEISPDNVKRISDKLQLNAAQKPRV